MGQTNSASLTPATTAEDVEGSAWSGPQSQGIVESKAHYKNTILATNNKVKLLSLRPINESQAYDGNENQWRRSSLKNLILGDATGPRFSQDLCSLCSTMSDYSFGIEFYPSDHTDHINHHQQQQQQNPATDQQKRGTSLKLPEYPGGSKKKTNKQHQAKPLASYPVRPVVGSRRLSAALTLASVDLNSFDSDLLQVNRPGAMLKANSETSLHTAASKEYDLGDRMNRGLRQLSRNDRSLYGSKLNNNELQQKQQDKGSLALKSDGSNDNVSKAAANPASNPLNETKLIILMQVCLPFIFAGFGNLSAGLVVNQIIAWNVFQEIPAFIIMLTAFVGFKGNIEMTMASRLSTLANLGMLDNSWQIRRAYASNMFLVCSQAISLSLFVALLALGIDYFVVLEWRSEYAVIVLASSLLTALILVIMSSVIISFTVMCAKLISVNPDNLSTLVSALYGDVSSVYIYALVANYIFTIDHTFWPMIIVCASITIWPLVTLCAYRFDETHPIALSSNIPIMIGILVSLVSGFIFSKVYRIYSKISLFHPVVNGFGANLIAVQASRISTWLWCSALDKIELTGSKGARKLSSLDARRLHSTGSIRVRYLGRKNPYMHHGTSLHDDDVGNSADISVSEKSKEALPESTTSFSKLNGSKKELVDKDETSDGGKRWWSVGRNSHFLKCIITIFKRVFRAIFWSYLGPSPNAKAAKMLLIMVIVAQTIYFLVIWLASPNDDTIVLTFCFYATYVTICLVQVGLLLMICEPLMTLLMSRNLDPDTYGITILMASADLLGTICLSLGFWALAEIHDPNAY